MNQPTPNDSGLSDIQKEAAKFLERDFNQCFQQMRHYDGQIFEISKFAFLGYTSLVGLALSLYEFGRKQQIDLSFAAGAAVIVGFIIGLFLFALVVRTRVYFVQVTRYINEQRGHFLKKEPLGFKNESRMYTDLSKPPFFDWLSSQTWFICLIAFLNATLFAVLLFITLKAEWSFLSILGGMIIVLFQLLPAIGYLKSRENKSAEEITK